MSEKNVGSICHIVPTTPPEFNGVGDYAHRLWEHWPSPRPDWHVATLRIPEGAESLYPGASLHRFQPNAQSLRDALIESGAEAVVLHYVPHAYHPKGVPLWLPRALRDWKEKTGGRLVVFFHELYAMGRPISNTRLLVPLAVRTLRQVVAVADAWATSTESFRSTLITVGGATQHDWALLPVGPNIAPKVSPSPRQGPRPANERLRIVAFGSPQTRLNSLIEHADLLRDLAQQGRVKSLAIVGARPSSKVAAGSKRAIEVVGLADRTETHFDLSAERASEILSQQDIALISIPTDLLGKSGVYASCAAHGLLCVIPGDRALTPDIWTRPTIAMTWPQITEEMNRLTRPPSDSLGIAATSGPSGRRLKLLVLSTAFAPKVGGLERVAETLNDGFLRRGHIVQVVTQTLGDSSHAYPVWRRPAWPQFRRLCAWSDLILFHNMSLAYAVRALGHGKPVLCLSHGEYGFSEANVRGFLLRKLLRRVSNIGVSRYVSGLLPIPGRTIYDPIELSPFDDSWKSAIRDLDILFVGRLVSSKGVRTLLDALSAWPSDPKPALTIIGDGPEAAPLQAYAEQLGLATVTFLGRQPQDRVLAEVRRHKVVAVPSTGPEGLGMVALEALVGGAFPVVSNIGGLPEAVGNCGLLLPPGSVPEWTAGLNLALDQFEHWRSRQNEVREHLQVFDVEHVLDQFEAVLIESVGR